MNLRIINLQHSYTCKIA